MKIYMSQHNINKRSNNNTKYIWAYKMSYWMRQVSTLAYQGSILGHINPGPDLEDRDHELK